MTKRIINVADLDFKGSPVPMPDHIKARYEGARMGDAGRRLGAQKLGYNVTILPPGKRAFPFHAHVVNEEMFYVIAGTGEVRVGAERHPIAAGDIIATPPGGPEAAHQIINTGAVELRYLAVSTRLLPEVVHYPDSKKFGAMAELTPDEDGKPRFFRFLGHPEDTLGYYDDEP